MEAAKDLPARLDVKDIDSDTRRSLINALGEVAGRLDAPAAAEATKDLRARLDGKDIDLDTRRSIIDAILPLVVVTKPNSTAGEIATMRLAMGSSASQLRDASESPAWARLEAISGEKFDRHIQRVLVWLQSCCKLELAKARQPFD